MTATIAPQRYRTATATGTQPAGMIVEVITLSLTGNTTGPMNRSARTSDGQQIRVLYPNRLECGTVQIPERVNRRRPHESAAARVTRLAAVTSGLLAGLGIDAGDLEPCPN